MFTKARIQLTIFYVLIITIIITVFSLFLYSYSSQHIRDTVEEDSPHHQAEMQIAEGAIDQLQYSLIIADAIVVVLSGMLSYWLAGRTLRPINIALNAQEQFSANASHELRTPLSVIKTENEVFLKNKQPSPQESHQLATSNLEEINRMASMVENLLMLARSKKTDMGLEKTKVNLSQTIQAVLAKIKPLATSKHLTLQAESPYTLSVLGNEKLLEQLFFNLIQNAVNYTNHGGIKITGISEEKVIITIQDTGIGISNENLKKIFEPFYKADESRTQSSTGVGLGLSIVQEIVTKHQGTITITSELNKGTLVTVTLPTYSA